MNPKAEDPRLPEWKLERFLLGELDSREMVQIGTQLESDEELRGKLEALRRSNQEILECHPVDWMGREIRRKLEGDASVDSKDRRRPLGIPLWQIQALSAVAVAVALLLFLPERESRRDTNQDQPDSITDTRIKGLEPQLLLFRKTAFGSERLENGARAHQGDWILVQYEAAGRNYGCILSIDGNGAMTRHAPLEGSEALRLTPNGAVSLDFSYELDDAPRAETFYFVTADSSFRLDVVFQAVREMAPHETEARGDSLRLPPSLRQTIFTLEKEPSHD